MLSELVSGALVGLWLVVFGLRFGVAPRSPARRRPAARAYRRQVAAVAKVGPRVVGLRIQIAVLPV